MRKLVIALAMLGAFWLFVGFSGFVQREGDAMYERAAYMTFQGQCKAEGALCIERPEGCTAEHISDC